MSTENVIIALLALLCVFQCITAKESTSQEGSKKFITLWREEASYPSGEWQMDSDSNGASCYDSKLSSFINTGLSHYSHDMGALSKYIMDQIVRASYPGSWLVHAEMIGSQRQGLEWQSATNGDLFSRSCRNGCYYHDTQTYIIVVRY